MKSLLERENRKNQKERCLCGWDESSFLAFVQRAERYDRGPGAVSASAGGCGPAGRRESAGPALARVPATSEVFFRHDDVIVSKKRPLDPFQVRHRESL